MARRAGSRSRGPPGSWTRLGGDDRHRAPAGRHPRGRPVLRQRPGMAARCRGRGAHRARLGGRRRRPGAARVVAGGARSRDGGGGRGRRGRTLAPHRRRERHPGRHGPLPDAAARARAARAAGPARGTGGDGPRLARRSDVVGTAAAPSRPGAGGVVGRLRLRRARHRRSRRHGSLPAGLVHRRAPHDRGSAPRRRHRAAAGRGGRTGRAGSPGRTGAPARRCPARRWAGPHRPARAGRARVDPRPRRGRALLGRCARRARRARRRRGRFGGRGRRPGRDAAQPRAVGRLVPRRAGVPGGAGRSGHVVGRRVRAAADGAGPRGAAAARPVPAGRRRRVRAPPRRCRRRRRAALGTHRRPALPAAHEAHRGHGGLRGRGRRRRPARRRGWRLARSVPARLDRRPGARPLPVPFGWLLLGAVLAVLRDAWRLRR